MTYDITNKGFEHYILSKRQCEHCGHKMLLGRCERVICSYCGHFIYKNKKVKFMHELTKARNKSRVN